MRYVLVTLMEYSNESGMDPMLPLKGVPVRKTKKKAASAPRLFLHTTM
jgi:hypothetical protein